MQRLQPSPASGGMTAPAGLQTLADVRWSTGAGQLLPLADARLLAVQWFGGRTLGFPSKVDSSVVGEARSHQNIAPVDLSLLDRKL